MVNTEQTTMDQVKLAADIVAVPTAIGFALGVVQLLAGLAALGYTLYRIYDLWEQRKARKKADD